VAAGHIESLVWSVVTQKCVYTLRVTDGRMRRSVRLPGWYMSRAEKRSESSFQFLVAAGDDAAKEKDEKGEWEAGEKLMWRSMSV